MRSPLRSPTGATSRAGRRWQRTSTQSPLQSRRGSLGSFWAQRRSEVAGAVRSPNDTRTATLVAHGLQDERVHPAQSVEMYTALRIKGVPTGLILYPREPHGLLERAHQLDFMGRLLEWFGRYVKEGVPATY